MSLAARLTRVVARLVSYEPMSGSGICPVWLHRWTLFRVGDVALYLHKFVGDDVHTDLHDHPKRFISIGLWGRYLEHRPGGVTREYRAPWIRSFPAQHIHRITLAPDRQPCWTLVLVLRKSRAWGFWTDTQWIPWHEYIGSDRASQTKSCPD